MNEVAAMSGSIDPREAGAALSEIGRREGEVIDAALVPPWFWWAVGAATVALGAVVDGRNAIAIALTAVAYASAVAVTTTWAILGGVRHVKVREAMLGPDGAVQIVAFVGIVVVGTITVAFALEALGVAQAATLATLACGAALVVGGPILMRRLRRVMARRGADVR
jgi:hypothetical protein